MLASSPDGEVIAQTTPPLTGAVSIKLPQYWSNDPTLWFSQVKAQFTARGITSEITKYAHVVSSLQPEVAQEVRDLLINQPGENPYTQLKSELAKHTSTSEQQRLHQLLNTKQLGDRKPTQLLRRMQQLLGESQLEPFIMKQLFLQHLPTNAQLILASSKDTLDTESLAKLADKILEVAPTHSTPSTLSTVTPPPAPESEQSTKLRELRELVSQLTTTINDFRLNFMPSCNSRRDRSRSQTHRHASPHNQNGCERTNPEQDTPPPVCWYHTKFGPSAKKCSPPCSFVSQSPENYSARHLPSHPKAACSTLQMPQQNNNS